jgi:hypothetical protein
MSEAAGILAGTAPVITSVRPSVTRSWNLTADADADAARRPAFTHEGPTGAGSAQPPVVSPDGRLLALIEESGAYRIVSTDDGKAAGKAFPGRPGRRPVQLSDKGHVLLSEAGARRTACCRRPALRSSRRTGSPVASAEGSCRRTALDTPPAPCRG